MDCGPSTTKSGILDLKKIAWLQEISAAAIGDTVPFGSLMLPEDDPRVVEAFNQLERRGMAEDDIKKSLTDGASWPQTHSKHQEARKQLGERLQLEAGQHRARSQSGLVR